MVEPLPGYVTHVPYGDVEALAAAVGDYTAAVFLEPIMGEGGVVVPPAGLSGGCPRDHQSLHGALLVLDEVQTGVGRHRSILRPPARRASRPTWSRWPRGWVAGCRSVCAW